MRDICEFFLSLLKLTRISMALSETYIVFQKHLNNDLCQFSHNDWFHVTDSITHFRKSPEVSHRFSQLLGSIVWVHFMSCHKDDDRVSILKEFDDYCFCLSTIWNSLLRNQESSVWQDIEIPTFRNILKIFYDIHWSESWPYKDWME